MVYSRIPKMRIWIKYIILMYARKMGFSMVEGESSYKLYANKNNVSIMCKNHITMKNMLSV